MNIDNGEILDFGLGCMPSQSPDRKRTVFTQRGRGIQLLDVDGSNLEDMDRHRWRAQWSPDVKYWAWGQGGNIIVINFENQKTYSDTSRPQSNIVQLHLLEPRAVL